MFIFTRLYVSIQNTKLQRRKIKNEKSRRKIVPIGRYRKNIMYSQAINLNVTSDVSHTVNFRGL
jgi:hypothetical protein